MYKSRDIVPPLTLGWIPYWNLRPLRVELQRAWGDGLKLVKGHPAEINRLMESGEIACAPSSSINLLLDPQMEIALPAGIASTGEVQSVYLTLPTEVSQYGAAIAERTAELRGIFHSAFAQYPDEFRMAAKLIWQRCDLLKPVLQSPPRLELSTASASGAMLSRILYRMYFGLNAYNRQATEEHHALRQLNDYAAIRLVIGDQALVERPAHARIMDLGSWWFELTGLPFVFGVWQQCKNATNALQRSRLMECVNRAQAKMKAEPSEYFPTPIPQNCAHTDIDLASYWKCINYRLGSSEWQSMLMFFALSRSFLNRELAEASAVRIVRWREQVCTSPWLA